MKRKLKPTPKLAEFVHAVRDLRRMALDILDAQTVKREGLSAETVENLKGFAWQLDWCQSILETEIIHSLEMQYKYIDEYAPEVQEIIRWDWQEKQAAASK